MGDEEMYHIGASTSRAHDDQRDEPIEVEQQAAQEARTMEKISIQVKPYDLIRFTWEENKFIGNVKEEYRSCYRALQIDAETFKQAIEKISELNPNIYVSLFFFNINLDKKAENGKTANDDTDSAQATKNCEPIAKRLKIGIKEELQQNFKEFMRNRQIIINLTSDKVTKTFYNKEDPQNPKETMNELCEIEMEPDEAGDFFPIFYRQLQNMASHSVSLNKFEDEFLGMLKKLDQLSLRYVAIHDISDSPKKLAKKFLSFCAENLTLDLFLAAVGVRFGPGNEMWPIGEALEDFPEIIISACKHEKPKIFDRLCLVLTSYFELKKQIEIANALRKLENFGKDDKVYELWKVWDFPFPTDPKPEEVQNDVFKEIFKERREFHDEIQKAKEKEKEDLNNNEIINNFLKNHPKLKIVYDQKNNAALHTALELDSLDVYIHLIRKGYRAIGEDFEELFSKNISKIAAKTPSDPKWAINLLLARSKIVSEEKEGERNKIRNWFEAVDKIEYGNLLIKAAAQCNELQIHFDFKSSYLDSLDPRHARSDGVMHSTEKLIMIAAEHPAEDVEQLRVKGVLAHELAHFVMFMIFGNRQRPYFNESGEAFKKFREIINKLEYLKNESEIDGFEGIVSNVYRNYDGIYWDAELIVRPFHIDASFYDKKEILEQARKKFKKLYSYRTEIVVPLMKKLNFSGMGLLKLHNNYAGLLEMIRKLELEFPQSDRITNLLNQKGMAVVPTNVPKLFLADIYSHLYELYGGYVKTKNIFVTLGKLNESGFMEEFKIILEKVEDVKIFVDCSASKNFDILKDIKFTSDKKIIFIISDESKSEKLLKMLKIITRENIEKDINYNWNELEPDIQEHLLKCEVKFQKHESKIALSELLSNTNDSSFVINAELLNAILSEEEDKIAFNSHIGIPQKDDNFDYFFVERKFNRKDKVSVSIENLIKENKDQKYVLVSAKAGNGKSWAMKMLAINLSKTKPIKWVTFVDLKLYTLYYGKCVSIFDLMEKVLAKLTNLERKIFSLMYEKGEVVLLFDGFDEIAPNYAKNVLNLIKSLEGNQIYVSTRNYFEISLNEGLKVKYTYKLDDFYRHDGIELIKRIWALHDNPESAKNDNEKDKLNLHKSKQYEKKARKIINQLMTNYREYKGTPQIYSLIGNYTKEEKKLDENLNNFQLYDEMWNKTRLEWENEKGEKGRNQGKNAQKKELNFLKIHELKAMQRFKPGNESYCMLNSKHGSEWENVDLEACGLMNINGDKIYFIHETFYEFFVAEFILRNLGKECAAEAFEYLQKVIAFDRCEVIQKFLDEGLSIEEVDTKEKNIEEIARNINDYIPTNIYKVFAKNLLNRPWLGDFAMKVYKKKNYDEFTKMIATGMDIQIFHNHGKTSNKEFQEFFINLIFSRLDNDTIKDIGNRMTKSYIKEFIECENDKNENIFFTLARSTISEIEQFNKFITFLKNFSSADEEIEKIKEIKEKMKERNKSLESIFHVCASNGCLEIFLRGSKTIFEDNLDELRNILMQKDSSGCTFLHELANSNLHSYNKLDPGFWNLLLEIFENSREELMKLFLELSNEGKSFINVLIFEGMEDRWDFHESKIGIWNEIKTFLSKPELESILRTKHKHSYNQNMLCSLSTDMWKFFHLRNYRHERESSIFIEHDYMFWDLMKHLCDTEDEFMKMLEEKDVYGNNFIHYCFKSFSKEIEGEHFFDFLNILIAKIDELYKTSSREKIKNLLKKSLNKFGQNFLQYGALFGHSDWFDRPFWRTLQKKFNFNEILEFITRRDIFGFNFFDIFILNAKNKKRKLTKEKLFEEFFEGLLDEEEKAQILSNDCNNVENLPKIAMPLNELNKILFPENFEGKNFIHQTFKHGNFEQFKIILKEIILERDVETLKRILKSDIREGYRSFNENVWNLMVKNVHSNEFEFETIQNILSHYDTYGYSSLRYHLESD